MRFGREPVFLVCAVAERHQRGPSAPAPGLNNLSVNDHKIRTVLSRPYYYLRHARSLARFRVGFGDLGHIGQDYQRLRVNQFFLVQLTKNPQYRSHDHVG